MEIDRYHWCKGTTNKFRRCQRVLFVAKNNGCKDHPKAGADIIGFKDKSYYALTGKYPGEVERSEDSGELSEDTFDDSRSASFADRDNDDYHAGSVGQDTDESMDDAASDDTLGGFSSSESSSESSSDSSSKSSEDNDSYGTTSCAEISQESQSDRVLIDITDSADDAGEDSSESVEVVPTRQTARRKPQRTSPRTAARAAELKKRQGKMTELIAQLSRVNAEIIRLNKVQTPCGKSRTTKKELVDAHGQMSSITAKIDRLNRTLREKL